MYEIKKSLAGVINCNLKADVKKKYVCAQTRLEISRSGSSPSN